MSAELSEAHADLARDETIFAEKLQEMRKLAKAHAALQAEHDALLMAATASAAPQRRRRPGRERQRQRQEQEQERWRRR